MPHFSKSHYTIYRFNEEYFQWIMIVESDIDTLALCLIHCARTKHDYQIDTHV